MASKVELDERFLRGERPVGSFEPDVLPAARAPLTILVLTNYRWTGADGGYGPLPLLLHDLAVRLQVEIPAIPCDVFILDDTNPPDRARMAAVATAALDGVVEPPRLHVIGVPEREALWTALDRTLPGDVDREVLRFLTTKWGYGPQRVRGDTATGGSPAVLSLDDDLRANEVVAASTGWLAGVGLSETPNSFVYAPRRAFDDHTMFRIVPAELIRPYLRVLGKAAATVRDELPGVPFSTCTCNTKDAGLLRSMSDASQPAMYITTHDGVACEPHPRDVVGVATGRKRSVPDVNAGRLLDYYVATGLETGGRLRVRAIPGGPHDTFVTAADTNPDCAVMGRAMTNPNVAKIPWLLSNPDVSARYGLAVGPYRAEDRLFTRPPGRGVLMAGVPAIFKHVRSETGFRPDVVASFWSELLGDILGDAVLEHLAEDRDAHRFAIGETGRFALPAETAGKVRDTAMGKVAAIRERLAALSAVREGDAVARERFADSLSTLLAQLESQCGPDFATFHRRIGDELAEQFDFVRRTFGIYYVLMDACRDLRERGGYPSALFHPPAA